MLRIDKRRSGLIERQAFFRISQKTSEVFTPRIYGRGHYTSQSEADLALCNFLAFWTGGDAARIDRLFRRSGLYRPK